MKVGDKVYFIEKIPQDDGRPPILKKRHAKIMSINLGDENACAVCSHPKHGHSFKHDFTPLLPSLDIEIDLPKDRGRREALIVIRESVPEGTGPNCWQQDEKISL